MAAPAHTDYTCYPTKFSMVPPVAMYNSFPLLRGHTDDCSMCKRGGNLAFGKQRADVALDGAMSPWFLLRKLTDP